MSAEKCSVQSGNRKGNKEHMSRIGDAPVDLVSGVSAQLVGSALTVKGPKGELTTRIPEAITVTVADNEITVARSSDEGNEKALHGLVRSLIANMVKGTTEGFEKRLEMVGTGYRAKKQGKALSLSAGFSHPVIVEPLQGVTLELDGDTVIVVSGIDKQQVGQMAADIRAIRKPEPYNGKGIRYQGEVIRRKAGKAAKTA